MAKRVERSTKISVYERRKNVLDLLVGGKSHSVITEIIQKKYGVADKTIDEDISFAYDTLRLDYAKDAEKIIDKHIAMYYNNYEFALSIGDVRSANQSLQFLEKLRGMHSPVDTQVNVQVNNNTIQLPEMTVEQIKELLTKNDTD